MRHLLAIFVVAPISEVHHLIDNLHTHPQFECSFFGFGGACLPVDNFALVLFFDFQIVFAGHIAVKIDRLSGSDTAATFGNCRLFLLFQMLLANRRRKDFEGKWDNAVAYFCLNVSRGGWQDDPTSALYT